MRRVVWLLLCVLPACEGTLELIGADSGPSGPAPTTDATVRPPDTDAGVAPPRVDGGLVPPPIDSGPPSIVWHAVLIAGDDSITAFDNARDTVRGLFVDEGVAEENLIELSRDRAEQVGGVRDTSVENIATAMTDLGVGEGDGCLVFMTSHGSRTGYYITDRDYLTPPRLDQILDAACGDRPTVALISACYSGVFVDDVAAPNRIILTAAREDRTSFGCSAEATYTYWDGCLIDNFHSATTWSLLYENVRKCIEDKEAGGFTPSYPQVSLGADVVDLPIFDRIAP